MRAPLAAGTSPDGEAWAPRKKDGGRPYANAASALSVRGEGLDASTFTINRKPEVLGHVGVRGAPARARCSPPRRRRPSPTAIHDRLGEEFTRVMKGGR
jgi:hypothetical protein